MSVNSFVLFISVCFSSKTQQLCIWLICQRPGFVYNPSAGDTKMESNLTGRKDNDFAMKTIAPVCVAHRE